ncbi:hypothetical protein [Terrisporobacter sp.]
MAETKDLHSRGVEKSEEDFQNNKSISKPKSVKNVVKKKSTEAVYKDMLKEIAAMEDNLGVS